MTTFEVAFANTTTDLTYVCPDIEQFDQKKLIQGWVVDSGSRYKSANCGYISMLYRDGQELGAAQANAAAVDADKKWYFDSEADMVYLFNSAGDPDTNNVIEGGQDWVTVKTEHVNRAADFIRSYINKPIFPREGTGYQSPTGRMYEDIIIRSNAILACSSLIRPYDPERADNIEKRAYDVENGTGYLDRIKSGEISLWNEVTERKGIGIVREVSLDSSTTGNIVDTKGTPTIAWDVVKVAIVTGGTFAQGTESTVTYSTWVQDSTGLKNSAYVEADIIDGSFQTLAWGVSIRFSAGNYVADDEWEIEIAGDEIESGSSIKTIDLRRV